MKAHISIAFVLCVGAGCTSSVPSKNRTLETAPAPRAGGPNWEEIDRGVARKKEREKKEATKVRTYTENGAVVQEEVVFEGTTESGKKITVTATSSTMEK